MGRHEYDYYATPQWCVEILLAHCDLPAGEWLEPCAGEGAIIDAVNDCRSDVQWSAGEIQPQFMGVLQSKARTVVIGDFRDSAKKLLEWYPHPAVIITNPPYYMAHDIVTSAIRFTDFSTIVAMLLPLTYLASRGRSQFLRFNVPDVYILSQRPEFVGGGTAPTDYAWMVWHRDRGNVGKVRIL